MRVPVLDISSRGEIPLPLVRSTFKKKSGLNITRSQRLPLKNETMSKGGIMLPEKAQGKVLQATVVAVGPGSTNQVLLPEYGGTKVNLEDKEYFLFRDADILGKYMVMAEGTAVLRRNRPGTKAKDFYNWPDESFEEMDSTLAVQQVQFCLELNGLAVKLQSECHPETCTQMTATEQWIFLCAAHKTPKECPAIDYTRHTLDGAACLLNSNKYFPSRVSIKESSVAKLGSVCRRIYRIFSHAYFHHRQIFDKYENETFLCHRFTRFVMKYNLMSKDNLIVPILEEEVTSAAPSSCSKPPSSRASGHVPLNGPRLGEDREGRIREEEASMSLIFSSEYLLQHIHLSSLADTHTLSLWRNRKPGWEESSKYSHSGRRGRERRKKMRRPYNS
ncbi:unnamed protein product [Coregonus sp. 'balchen']|nr:unnamed protein product [Coregonus sp. 'balchen']